MIDVVIIGGGASGLLCAVLSGRAGLKTVLLEKMDRVGRKLLATGNGRCNLMNTGELRFDHGRDFAAAVLSKAGADRQRALWEELGLRLRQEEAGRVYPAGLQASMVLDTLRMALEGLPVDIRTETRAEAVRILPRGYEVLCADGLRIRTRAVVMAGGGCAQPKLGSDGSAVRIMEKLGYPVTPFQPVLTTLICDMTHLSGLSGIRVKALVTAEQDGKAVRQENGEVLFTDYGLSGVCVMNSSGCLKDQGGAICLDLLPSLGFEDEAALKNELMRKREDSAAIPMEWLLTGLTVPRLAMNLMRASGIAARGRTIGSLTEREAAALAHTMHCFRIPVRGRKGFEQAQVSRGGVDPEQFDPETLRSRRHPGLYALGEMLDVDGECGGYHLMFAFACAMLAGNDLKETLTT